MNTQRTIIGLVWVVSLLAAYYIGGSGEPARPSNYPETAAGNTPGAGSGRDGSLARQPRAVVRQLDGTEAGNARGEKQDIAALIARARVTMGTGMGGMTNIRAMLRAVAPLAELDDSQIQEALAEVEKSVHEPQQKMMFFSLLLGQWAEKDGKAARRCSKAPPTGRDPVSTIKSSASGRSPTRAPPANGSLSSRRAPNSTTPA